MKFYIKTSIRLAGRNLINGYHGFGKPKVFCIGLNKTGTTSVTQAFSDLGFSVGDQETAEHLTYLFYFKGKYKPIIAYSRYCGQVFQDVPFSLPETYKYLDKYFPKAKFILTVRDNAEQWYNSLTKFHAIHFGRNGNIPTSAELKDSYYYHKGFMGQIVKLYGGSDTSPYEREPLIRFYNQYNSDVEKYFAGREDKLLILNVAERSAYSQFLNFLGVNSKHDDFLWLNKTAEQSPAQNKTVPTPK